MQGTPGADFHPQLELPEGTAIITKGVSDGEDGYSCFDGRDEKGLPLAEHLRQRHIRHLFVGGLATDYCVKQTVLDALKAGFRVTLLLDAIRGVDLDDRDSARAIDQMLRAGADTATLETAFEED